MHGQGLLWMAQQRHRERGRAQDGAFRVDVGRIFVMLTQVLTSRKSRFWGTSLGFLVTKSGSKILLRFEDGECSLHHGHFANHFGGRSLLRSF